jgi:hypothetical protein
VSLSYIAHVRYLPVWLFEPSNRTSSGDPVPVLSVDLSIKLFPPLALPLIAGVLGAKLDRRVLSSGTLPGHNVKRFSAILMRTGLLVAQ